MIRATDDLGRQVYLGRPPQRVVSLVPSDTLTVSDLGAGARLVGRTDYCVEPAELARRVPAIGGTKNPRVEEIIALRPELVLANQEENTRQDIEALDRAGVPVFVAFPRRVAEGVAHVARLAKLLGLDQDPQAKELVRQAYQALRRAEQAREGRPTVGVFCPIWMDPLMTIHADTFISDMLALVGAHNVFSDRERRYPLAADLGKATAVPPSILAGRDTRYPRVTLEEVVARAPDVVLLPDEPHPFTEADAAVFRGLDIPAARHGTVVFCGGRDLCWSGSRSIAGIERLGAQLDELRAQITARTTRPS
jgi:ABC-type Fe3+-hydroxamate transport system substrate-binding protein